MLAMLPAGEEGGGAQQEADGEGVPSEEEEEEDASPKDTLLPLSLDPFGSRSSSDSSFLDAKMGGRGEYSRSICIPRSFRGGVIAIAAALSASPSPISPRDTATVLGDDARQSSSFSSSIILRVCLRGRWYGSGVDVERCVGEEREEGVGGGQFPLGLFFLRFEKLRGSVKAPSCCGVCQARGNTCSQEFLPSKEEHLAHFACQNSFGKRRKDIGTQSGISSSHVLIIHILCRMVVSCFHHFIAKRANYDLKLFIS